jgi:hypothetical protein
MEYPGGWDLLVGSLSCTVDQPDLAWAFLLRQALVRDRPGDRATFLDAVRLETERGDITGPTLAKRVAMSLEAAGIALPAGSVADPYGKTARERLKAL